VQSEDDQEAAGGGRRRPTADRQRRLVARCERRTDGGGAHTYAVGKVWYRRWEEHVGKARGFVAGSAPAPGPVDMDTQNDDANTFVSENVWKLLVAWYGVAATHHLDRKHLFFKDEKVAHAHTHTHTHTHTRTHTHDRIALLLYRTYCCQSTKCDDVYVHHILRPYHIAANVCMQR